MTNVTVEVDDLKALLAVAKLSVEERQRLELAAAERADRGLMQTLHRVPEARERLEAQANEAGRVENGIYEKRENIVLSQGDLEELAELMAYGGRRTIMGGFGTYSTLRRYGFVECAPVKYAIFWSGQDIPSYESTMAPPTFAFRLTHRGREYALMQGMQIDDPKDSGLEAYVRRHMPNVGKIPPDMTINDDGSREEDGHE